MRESWAQIFSAGPRARVHITQQVAISGMMLAVHSVHENFALEGRRERDSRPAGRRHQRLPAHRGGLAHDRAPRLARAGAAAAAPPRDTPPKTLH